MARGGRRKGKPGAAYAQRTDLQGSAQAIQAAPGQAYGMAQQAREAQAVLPVAGTAVPPQPTASAPLSAGPQRPVPEPGGLGFLGATARPGEPVTAGAPVGPGGGVELLGTPAGMEDDVRTRLRAIYMAFPTEEIRQMIEDAEDDL